MRTPWRSSTKSRCASIWTTWIGASIGEGVDAGDVDRMVAAEDDRDRAGREDLAHAELDIGVAARSVSVWIMSASPISTMRVVVRRQIDDVVLVVVGAGMAEGEQRRGLADGARAGARARAPLRAEIERRAEHRDIGLDRCPSRGRADICRRCRCRRRAGRGVRFHSRGTCRSPPHASIVCGAEAGRRVAMDRRGRRAARTSSSRRSAR